MLFDVVVPAYLAIEARLLGSLTADERATLAEPPPQAAGRLRRQRATRRRPCPPRADPRPGARDDRDATRRRPTRTPRPVGPLSGRGLTGGCSGADRGRRPYSGRRQTLRSVSALYCRNRGMPCPRESWSCEPGGASRRETFRCRFRKQGPARHAKGLSRAKGTILFDANHLDNSSIPIYAAIRAVSSPTEATMRIGIMRSGFGEGERIGVEKAQAHKIRHGGVKFRTLSFSGRRSALFAEPIHADARAAARPDPWR